MLLLVSGMIFCYAQRGALPVAAHSVMKNFRLSESQMGILLSAFFWSYSFMQMPAGWMVDRFGVRRAYAIGYSFWSGASALTGVTSSLAALMALRILLGVGQAVAFPASARAVANWFQERERGIVTAAYLAGVRLGQAIIAVVGAAMLVAYDVKIFFLLTGLLPLIWLLPWIKFLKPWEATTDAGTTDGQTAQANRFSFLQSLGLLKNRTVMGIFLGFFAYDYAWFVYFNWLPTYLVRERKFTTREMGVYSSIPYVAMSVIIILSGSLSDWLIRRGHSEVRVRKGLIIIGLAIACLIVPAGMVEDKMTSVWLLTTSLCGLGISAPNTWTLTQAMCSKKIVGTVSGIQNFGGNIGGILAPVLTGIIAQQTQSFAIALSITGGVLVGGMLAYWVLISIKVELSSSSSYA
jgi:MFS family permease